MTYVDDVIVNPEEAPMTPARTPASLSEMGIGVIEAKWGESAIEGTSIRTVGGQRLVDRRGKAATIELTLMVREDRAEEVDLPEAAYRLQQIFGSMQERETWIMRVPLMGGDFAGPILYKITGVVSLGDFLGWGKGEQPDVRLILERDPVGYSTEEDESEEFKTTTSRQLVYTLPPDKGTAQGLKRIRVTNNGIEDWRGLIWAEECRDAPDDLADPTAQLAYLAKNLTPMGGAEVKTISGAEVVQHSALTPAWVTILSSEIAGDGQMTHRGGRRMWMRIYDPGSEPGGIHLRLEWRPRGSSVWNSNGIVATPLVAHWQLIDLGGCQLSMEEDWEWQLAARAPAGAGVIRIRDVYPLPSEQFLTARQPVEFDSTPRALLVTDAFNQSAGNATGKASEIGGTYSALSGSDSTDFTVADGTLVRTAVSDAGSPFANLTVKGRGIGVPVELTDFAMRTDFKISGDGAESVEWGHVLNYVDNKHFVLVRLSFFNGGWHLQAQHGIEPLHLGQVRLQSGDFGEAPRGSLVSIVKGTRLIVYLMVSGQVTATLQYNDAQVGALGRAYIWDEMSGSAPATREYDNLVIWDPDLPALCYAGRSIELRSDQVRRQHLEDDDSWGPVVPEGFYPRSVPGGLERRTSRGIFIPTQGDFDALPDDGSNPLSLVDLRRDGHQFAREPSGVA